MANRIEIWQPKYSTDEVLIGCHHVQSGDNEIVFTKAPHLKDKIFSITGEKIRTFKRQPNGKGEVYCVPMKELTEK